jgi:hypothetical protein
MKAKRIIIRRLDQVANSIGYVCIFWAWLDDYLGELILKLCPFDPRKIVSRDLEKLDEIFRSHGDIRDKIRILRAVAFVRKWDNEWFKKVSTILDFIDNDLRVRRNRMVHDSWFAPKRILQRRTRHIKFKKRQAFALELSTVEHIPVKPSEVAKVARDTIDAMMKLIGLAIEHEEIQKIIDEEVDKGFAKDFVKLVLKIASSQPKSEQPNPPQAQPISQSRSSHSRRGRRPKSSSD